MDTSFERKILKTFLEIALEMCNFSIKICAQRLGMSERKLYRMIKRLGIDLKAGKEKYKGKPFQFAENAQFLDGKWIITGCLYLVNDVKSNCVLKSYKFKNKILASIAINTEDRNKIRLLTEHNGYGTYEVDKSIPVFETIEDYCKDNAFLI